MAIFYLLPPRPLLAQRLASFLKTWLPGLEWEPISPADLSDLLQTAAKQHNEVYLVYREDLPVGEDPVRSLTDGFGAEPGDVVVEVRALSEAVQVRRWQIGEAA